MSFFWSGMGGWGGGGGRGARVSECFTMNHFKKKYFLVGRGVGVRGARVSEFLLLRIQV